MTHSNSRQPDDAKLGELILYIAKRSEEDPRFGATKLNKILFYSDFGFYLNYRSPITNHVYRRLQNGPVPKDLPRVRDDLVESKALAIQEREFFGRLQKRPIALRPANLELFTAQEIAWVDEIITRLKDLSGTGVSDLSHEFSGWIAAGDKEDIPYETVFVYQRELSDEEQAHARSLSLA